MQDTHGSELRQLLDHITRSYEAAQRALTSPAIMARHEFIQKRMEEIEMAHDKVKHLVGDEFRATDLVVKQLAAVEDQKP